jgi:hypothetical protein
VFLASPVIFVAPDFKNNSEKNSEFSDFVSKSPNYAQNLQICF